MRDERGFTLIELLLVFLIIGILASIALPNLLSQRDKGQDAEAKSNAANVRLHVESCAAGGEKTYLSCSTAAQIDSNGLGIGMLDLPPLDQFAAAGGNGGGNSGGNGGGNGNGGNAGAQCIVQSNGARSCTQTGPIDPGTGTGTTNTNTTTTDTNTNTTTTDTNTNTTTTDTGTGTTTTDTGTTGSDAAPDVTTGGAAPDVGDCVEGGAVEKGCVGIVGTDGSYTITAVSRSGHIFKIVNNGTRTTRPCEPAGKGGCPGSGFW